MRILVTGVNGQLGYDVVKQLTKNQLTVMGIDIDDLDLTDETAVIAYFNQSNPFDAIIHCAAYTAVDKAEEEQEVAEKVNVLATKYLVNEAKKMNAKFMYISTDYVYSGTGDAPFCETSETAPLSVYGKTKLAGEQVVQETLAEYFIVRISWVFGINGNNFIKTMLRLSETNEELTVVNDQIGSPTYTYDLAILLTDMIKSTAYGIYQATNEGYCSWYEFALKIFEIAGRNTKVIPVDSLQFKTKAVRPKNSRMSKDKLEKNGFKRLRSWEAATTDFIKEYLNESEKNEKNV